MSAKSLETAAWISFISLCPSCVYFLMLSFIEMWRLKIRYNKDGR
jgi:hypothetical protein